MNKDFYSDHEDGSIYKNDPHVDVDFQKNLYDFIMNDILSVGYGASQYTNHVETIKTIIEDAPDMRSAMLTIADINDVLVEDIAYDPTFQVYIKCAQDLIDLENNVF